MSSDADTPQAAVSKYTFTAVRCFAPTARRVAARVGSGLGAPLVSSRDRVEMSGGNSLEPGLKKYRELQAQIAKLQSGAGQANTQIMENEMVLKELDLLEEDAQVFKLIGPVLVKQELVEVKTNVSKRIRAGPETSKN